MRRKSSKPEIDFKKDIPEYSDEKIIEILKLRDYYQPEAAKLAIEEAIKREIIFSEQDLFADEFKVRKLQFSLFPSIKRDENRTRIRRSIARSMVVCGVLPLVFGFIQSNIGNRVEGLLLLLFGVLWIFSAAQLIRNYHKILVHALMLKTVIAVVYLFAKLLSISRIVFFDFFLVIALSLLIFYGLFFISRTNNTK